MTADTSRAAVEALITEWHNSKGKSGYTGRGDRLADALAALLDERDAARDASVWRDTIDEQRAYIRDLEATNRKISERSANHHDNAIKWRERAERAEVGYETMLESLNRVEAEHNKLTAELADEMKRADENYDDMHEWRSKARKLAAKLDAAKAYGEKMLNANGMSWCSMHGRSVLAILADTDEGKDSITFNTDDLGPATDIDGNPLADTDEGKVVRDELRA